MAGFVSNHFEEFWKAKMPAKVLVKLQHITRKLFPVISSTMIPRWKKLG